MDEIKACPFCGKDGHLIYGRGMYHVQCESYMYVCFAITFPDFKEEDVIASWNKRVNKGNKS